MQVKSSAPSKVMDNPLDVEMTSVSTVAASISW